MRLKKTARRCQGPRGITLIELMIVVAVVGILSAIAYPSYQEFVLRGRRADAKAGLQRAAQWLEKAATVAGAYPHAADTLTKAGLDWSENRRYIITATTLTANEFVLQATPTGFVDAKCGEFTLTQAGIRGKSGTMSLEYCWGK